jgi:hypothetical protein
MVLLRVLVLVLVGGRLQPVLDLGQVMLQILMGKELMGVLLKVLALGGDQPQLPLLMGLGLHLVVMQMMLQPLPLLLPMWELRLPGLARAQLLVLVPVQAGPLVVLMQPLVLIRARLHLHGIVVT